MIDLDLVQPEGQFRDALIRVGEDAKGSAAPFPGVVKGLSDDLNYTFVVYAAVYS